MLHIYDLRDYHTLIGSQLRGGCLIFEFCCILMHLSQNFPQFQWVSGGPDLNTSLQGVGGLSPLSLSQFNVWRLPQRLKSKNFEIFFLHLEPSGFQLLRQSIDCSSKLHLFFVFQHCVLYYRKRENKNENIIFYLK